MKVVTLRKSNENRKTRKNTTNNEDKLERE
jgi:hypothetical protein